MNRLITTIVAALFAAFAFGASSACDASPVVQLDANGHPTESSLTAIREDLTSEEAAAFDDALVALVLGEVLEVRDGDNGLGALLALGASGAAGEAVADARAKHAFKRLEGLSASEVIQAGSDQIAQHEERRRAQEEAKRVEKEAKRAALREYHDRLASSVVFSTEGFRRTSDEWEFFAKRMVNVTLENTSQAAIAGLTFKAEVRTPGRSVPWDEGDGHQVWFDGGVEQGEVRTEQHRFRSAFKDESYPEGSVFTATLECVYGPKDAEGRHHPMYVPPGGVCNTIRR